MSELRPLSEALDAVLDSSSPIVRLAMAWRAVVGDELANDTMPVNITSGGVLRIRCSSGVVASEVTHGAADLLARCAGIVAPQALTGVRTTIGRLSSADRVR